MPKRTTLSITLLLVALLSGCSAKQTSTIELGEKPNIIFILTDDQRWDSVGFMGHPLVKTPNLDKLAAEGHTFDNAFVTSAICTPSRASYFLGQYERRHGINFNSGTSMTPEAWAKTYPAVLKENGYVTGYVGKNHLPVGEKGYYSGLMEKSFDFWYAGHHHLGFYPKDKHAIFDIAKLDTQTEVIGEGALAFLDPESNEAFMGNAKSFLESRPDDQPFCLSIALNLPHDSSTGTMKQLDSDDALYRTAYREHQKTLPLIPHYIAKADIKESKLPADLLLTQIRQTGYDWVDTPKSARERMIRIMQTVTGIDRMIGELRAKLEATGLADNTVIIFTSDHGLFQGENGIGGKSLCYESCMKVPFVIYDPRITQGKRLDNIVMSIDVAPTILSLAGVQIPDTMQGSDISPLLHGEKVDWRDAAFGENLWSNIFGNPRCETVRTADYRYIRYFKNDNLEKRKNTPKSELYNVSEEMAEDYRIHLTSTLMGETIVYEELFHTAKDPYETTNLVNDSKHAAILQKLRAKCHTMLAEAKGGINESPATIRVANKWTKTMYRKRGQD